MLSGWFRLAAVIQLCGADDRWRYYRALDFLGASDRCAAQDEPSRPAVTLAVSPTVGGARSIRAPTERIDCLTVSPPNSSLLSPRYASREERGRSWLLNLANLRVDN